MSKSQLFDKYTLLYIDCIMISYLPFNDSEISMYNKTIKQCLLQFVLSYKGMIIIDS